ncbi:polypeptide N-acetylgalactosaminyltransferase 18 isoform X1 [Clarias magur]|uniref:Polypeptide N-acetylgalactosaminyltransferase 18 isoform X1 n=1 Tax=Clarias magur TaxID=1594786 RepID=A0A8J4UGF6_CLAMG|nr:polypeptide N-acetylgalactosaminyltransferase 18 isoform X1 [Clarias magur]
MPRALGEQRKRVRLRAHRPEMHRTEMDYHQHTARELYTVTGCRGGGVVTGEHREAWTFHDSGP